MADLFAPSRTLEDIIKECIQHSQVLETSLYLRGIAEGYSHEQIDSFFKNWLLWIEQQHVEIVVKNLTTNKYVIVVRPCNQDHFLEYLFHKDPKAKAVFTKNSMSKYETIKVETTLESEKISKDCRILSIEKFNQEGDSI